MGSNRARAVVLGSGIAGSAAALVLARLGYAVEVTPERESCGSSRLISVPGRILPLLAELGIVPAALGVRSVVRHAAIAWEDAAPARIAIAPKLHLDQAMLEAALRDVVARNPAICIGAEPGSPTVGEAPARLIDASGRRSVTATAASFPEQRWVTRFWRLAPPRLPNEGFALAALSIGYALRIGAGAQTLAGLAAPRSFILDFAGFTQLLTEHGASWLLAGAGQHEAGAGGKSAMAKGGVSSVAWTTGWADGAEPVGDALLAGDTLCSQGVAWALSDVIHLHLPFDQRLARAAERRYSHLARLDDLARTNRFAAEPAWRDYAAFLCKGGRETAARVFREEPALARA